MFKLDFIQPPFFHTPETVAQLGSILTHSDGFKWLMNHYVTVYFLNTETHAIVEGFFDADKLWDCPLVCYSSVFRSDVMLYSKNIINLLKNLLFEKNYIYLLANHYYLKDSSIYKKEKLGHSMLLSGYDEVSKTFLYSDFFAKQQNKYMFAQSSEADLKLALTNCRPDCFDYNDSLYINQFQINYFERIQYFRVNHSVEYIFSPISLLKQLTCYAAGIEPQQITYIPCGFYMKNAAWGMRIFDSFLKYLERAVVSQYSWKDVRRFISFLGNMKVLMQLRLDYLNENYALEHYALHNERNRQLMKLQEVLLRAVLVNLGREKIIGNKSLDLFMNLLREYVQKEEAFVAGLIDSLQKLCN